MYWQIIFLDLFYPIDRKIQTHIRRLAVLWDSEADEFTLLYLSQRTQFIYIYSELISVIEYIIIFGTVH